MQIRVADAGVFDVDEDLVWAGLRDGDLLELDWAAGLLDDLRHLLFWDLRSHVVGCEVEERQLGGGCELWVPCTWMIEMIVGGG